MSYKVSFLNDEEFDQLPASNITNRIGIAYPESGEAYVRQSGSHILDVFTAFHEMEHLSGNDLDEHYDKENKCFYKDFGQTLQAVSPALAFIPGIGPILSGASAVGGGVLSAKSQAKAQKQAMSQQQQMGGDFMSQFQPQQMPFAGSSQGSPNVITPGGYGGGAQSSMGGGFSSGLRDRLQQFFGEGMGGMQKGYFADRSIPGGF